MSEHKGESKGDLERQIEQLRQANRKLQEERDQLHSLAGDVRDLLAQSNYAPVDGYVHAVFIDYAPELKSRYPNSPHPHLLPIIERHRSRYEEVLIQILQNMPTDIPYKVTDDELLEPSWWNLWLPPLDALVLYGLLVQNNPCRYLEVGSGVSTKFARRAIQDHNLQTEILSIDPEPRESIDRLCDRVIRDRVENVDLSVFDQLQEGDILFIDNSHRVFMNSDVTVLCLDVLPKLVPGVLVHFHDIFTPYDYPESHVNFYYTEQYLIEAFLLAGHSFFDIVLPNSFIVRDSFFSSVLDQMWAALGIEFGKGKGASFWVRTKDVNTQS